MNTRAEIETLINTDLADASNISASEHRNVIKDSSSSLLNNIYPTVLTDSEATNTYLSFTDASSWTATITKLGRRVSIDIDVTASGTMQLAAATISTPQLQPSATTVYKSIGRLTSGEYLGISLGSSGNISFVDPILTGERVSFNIIYNTLN